VRIFLDAGGHEGETLAVVMQPRWGFDRIWTFEPAPVCIPVLEAMADDRVTVVPAGLWSSDCEMELFQPGERHASVDPWASLGPGEMCQFIDVAAWMREHISPTDDVWLKINIEAAEIEVIDRLLVSGEMAKVDHLVVHFDVEYMGQPERATALRRQLDASKVAWREARDAMFGRTVAAKTETWLLWTTGHRVVFHRRKIEHLARRGVWETRKAVRRATRAVTSRDTSV
jgi:FkbM family methyltransferase